MAITVQPARERQKKKQLKYCKADSHTPGAHP